MSKSTEASLTVTSFNFITLRLAEPSTKYTFAVPKVDELEEPKLIVLEEVPGVITLVPPVS